MFGKVKRLEAEIQRLEKRIEQYYEFRRSHTDRVERSLNLLMEHLKVYEHVEPAQPEKREIRKGKKPAMKQSESAYGGGGPYNQMSGHAVAQSVFFGGSPSGWLK